MFWQIKDIDHNIEYRVTLCCISDSSTKYTCTGDPRNNRPFTNYLVDEPKFCIVHLQLSAHNKEDFFILVSE